jgi:hypothetical protein
MSTEMILLEAELAIAQARDDSIMLSIGFVLLIAIISLWLVYVFERWSWIPRRKQRRFFGERW